MLWLVSAWPSRLSPFNGDFVQRHAIATSDFVPVHVIFVVRDPKGEVTRSVLKETRSTGSLTETVIYYYCPDTAFPLIGKIRSAYLYRRHFREAIRQQTEQHGLPAHVHVHWGMKAGMEAMRMRRKWGIPYFVTEHWTGFLQEATDRFDKLPHVIRQTWKRVLYASSGVQAVSEALASALRTRFSGLPVSVIPNVVDTSVFFPRPGNVAPYRFIHVSGMDDFKDPHSLFTAFRLVLEKYPDAELQVYGHASAQMKALAASAGAGHRVYFHGEVPQQELATAMCASTALVLYSRYETFGCVIIEAHACGVPVIVTDLPVFRERVTQGQDGLLVKAGDPAALASAMLQMIQERESYDPASISTKASRSYAYPVVGKRIADAYGKNSGT